MDLLAEGPRSGGGWGGLGQSAAVIISKGQKGIRRGREVEARYSGQLLGHTLCMMIRLQDTAVKLSAQIALSLPTVGRQPQIYTFDSRNLNEPPSCLGMIKFEMRTVLRKCQKFPCTITRNKKTI